MRITDYIEQSFRNLWRKRLRTALTVFGVMIGIGALVSMFSFGKGVQKNITEQFEELELFNYISVYPGSREYRFESKTNADANEGQKIRELDDEANAAAEAYGRG